jgi:signal transduction histidine kinase/ligand-binding sensor domain-containing protein
MLKSQAGDARTDGAGLYPLSQPQRIRTWLRLVQRTQPRSGIVASLRTKPPRRSGQFRAWARLELCVILTAALVSAGVAAVADRPTFRDDPDYLIDTWDTEAGWPESSAETMAQTPDGYLWLGTLQSLIRFDGVKFRVFEVATFPQFSNAGIKRLHLDRSGQLWAGTTKGVVVRGATEWRATPLPFPDNNRGNQLVHRLAERPDGDLLVTTLDGGVLEFSGGQFHALPAPPGATNRNYWGCADADGHWWVAQHQFVGKWDGQRWAATVSPADLPELRPGQVACVGGRAGGHWLLRGAELRHYQGTTETQRTPVPGIKGEVLDLLEDSRGNVWIATLGAGLWQVSANQQVRHWTPANGLPAYNVHCVFEDREQNLWVGTAPGGLTRFKARTVHTVLPVTNRFQFARFALTALPGGGLVIAAWRQGLWRADAGRITQMTLPKPMTAAAISALSLLGDRQGCLWIGSMTNGVWRVEGEQARWLPMDDSGRAPVREIFEDSQGRVWLAGDQSVAVLEGDTRRNFGPADGLPAGYAGSFAEDATGRVWIAHQRGVFRWETNRWTELTDAGGASLRVNGLLADAAGTIWLGSSEAGIAAWHDGRLLQKRLPPELPMRGVFSLLEDHLGFFWMTSPQGVLRARRSELQAWLSGSTKTINWQVLDVSDGLPAAACESSVCDAQGRLWFATPRGVAWVMPAGDRPAATPPAVHIEELTYHRAARQVYAEGEGAPPPPVRSRLESPFPASLTLPPGSRRLEVHYTAFDFTAPEKLRFQTRLEPGDSDWQDVGDRRVASYYDFLPGKYVFRVRAVNHHGVWNEAGASLPFTVQPYFWQSLWFKAAVLAGLVAVVYGSVHRRVLRLEKARAAQQSFTQQLLLSQENERKRVAAELHDGLGQDLMLVKNRLVMAAARQADPAELARQLDAATAATTRAIGEVRAISHALRPTALEQVGLTKAIEWMVEQLGEGNATKFAAELDTIDGLLAPEMEMNLFRIIQEGLNNIIRHAGATQVILEVKRETGGLRVSLFDDGRGFDAEKLRGEAAARRGLGLASMDERVKYLAGSLDLQSAPGRGTRMTVQIPLPKTKT